MIREWRISRFKSIAGTEVLPFKPLTILAGPNSAGKSSVIQSVLLMAQSLASRVPDRQLVLNGELVKLGTFEDVRNQQADEATVDFGFDLELDFSRGEAALAAGTGTAYYEPLFRPMSADIPHLTLSANIAFGPAGDPGADASARPLQADVVKASFRTSIPESQTPVLEHDDEQTFEPDVTIERRTDAQVEQLLSTINATTASSDAVPGLRDALRYSIVLSQRARQMLRRRIDLPAQVDEIVATRLEHFLPAAIVWRQRSLDRFVSASIRRFSIGSQSTLEPRLQQWVTSTDPVRAAFAKAVTELAKEQGENPVAYIKRLRTARNDLDQFQSLVGRVQSLLGEPWTTAMSAVEGPLPEEQAFAFQGLHAFFEDMRYLGPLRDDPKPLYAMSGAIDPTEIGSKGQYTAAVLDVNSHVEIEFIPPGEITASRARLSEAIRVWLQHFGMADAIRTTDKPKLGYELLVRPTGIRGYVDLTNVGVGVSQVLPILVMALVSKPGSVLLFEQPELHLHPAVQSQLGDFFIALARSSRQCVVETHSEYLINRIRLRIAEAETANDLSALSIVHFVERPGAASKFTPVVINEFGAIPEWPRGFFDQSPNESEQILRAAMKKKAALAAKARDSRG
jgi:predicted ATPase